MCRTTTIDDRRGVGEPLNETLCGCVDCNCPGLIVRGTHLLRPGPLAGAAAAARALQQKLNDPVVLAFASVKGSAVAAAGVGAKMYHDAAASALRSVPGSEGSSSKSSNGANSSSGSSSGSSGSGSINDGNDSALSSSRRVDGSASDGASAGATIPADQWHDPHYNHQTSPEGISNTTSVLPHGLDVVGRWSGLKSPRGLPPNVHLLTLMSLEGEGQPGKILIRLAHTFQVGVSYISGPK